MSTKDYILYASIIINLILGYWIYDMTKDDQKPNEDLLKSKGRVEVLQLELINLRSERDSINTIKDSINYELAKKPKERIIIKDTFDEEINSIIRLPLDSSVSYLSNRLSKVRVD